MYNSFRYLEQPNNKKQPRILDYRNGKYQGMTLENSFTRSGLGMVLDQNYLFLISLWKDGIVQGQSMIIFPDNSIFYGFVKDYLPFGICSFLISNKIQIHSSIGKESKDLFVIDLNNSKNLILLEISKQLKSKIVEEPTVNQKILIQQYYKNKGKGGIQINNEISYTNNSEKWQIIQNYFKIAYKSQLRDYKQFIKHYFKDQSKNQAAKIYVMDSKQQFQVNYKNSSLQCRIKQSSQNQFDYSIKMLGYYNHSENMMETSKKISLKKGFIQQNILQTTKIYSENPKQRPVECLKRIQTYYKQSLQFVNEFIQLDYLYRIDFIYQSIELFVSHFLQNKYAQVLLENTVSPKQSREATPNVHIERSEQILCKQNLEKAKVDIYKAIKNKSQPKNISSFQIKPQKQFKESNITRISYNYNQKSPFKDINQGNTPPKRRQKNYLQSLQNSNNKISPGKRSYVYLTDQYTQNSTKKLSGNKYQYSRAIKQEKQEKSKHNLSKFAYLEKQRPRKKQKTEQLEALTKYYEQIQNELKKKQSPIKRKPSFKYVDKGYTKRHTINQIQRETNKIDNPLNYPQNNKKTPQKHRQYNYSPLSRKKIIKYDQQ